MIFIRSQTPAGQKTNETQPGKTKTFVSNRLLANAEINLSPNGHSVRLKTSQVKERAPALNKLVGSDQNRRGLTLGSKPTAPIRKRSNRDVCSLELSVGTSSAADGVSGHAVVLVVDRTISGRLVLDLHAEDSQNET